MTLYFISRVPFTLLLAGVILVLAVLTDTHSTHIGTEVLRDFGHAPMHWQSPAEWFRLATAVFLTVGGWRFWASLFMLLVSVGGLEWRRGAKFAAAMFFGIHIVTLLLEYLLVLLPLSALGHPLADALRTSHDVGPSAGYYGCLGGLLGSSRLRGQKLAVLAVMVWLTVRLGMSLSLPAGWRVSVPADLAHLIAFPLGLATSTCFQEKRCTR